MNLDCNYYCENEKLIAGICENEYQFFFDKPNVVGVALGYKIKKGFITCQKCITVFVSNKVAENQFLPSQLVPFIYKNNVTDIVEIGELKGAALTARIRPVYGGYSVGPESIPDAIGTAGCLVTDGKFKYILGCNHVFAHENTLPRGTHILQPGPGDRGVVSKDAVASLQKYVPLKKITKIHSPDNYVDCAIAKELEPGLVSPEIAFINLPQGVTNPTLYAVGQKVGRTTERTTGVITNINATVKIKLELGQYLFKKQIVTTSMGKKGDSGALLLDNRKLAMGLFVAIADSATVYSPITKILSELAVKLVTKK